MSSLRLSAARELAHFDEPLELEREGRLERWQLGYELIGPEGAPVVLALGGISANAHVCAHDDDATPGWWDRFVGPGRSVDTRRYRVLGVDWLGGCGASSGPQDPDFLPGVEWPRITPADHAAAIARLLRLLRLPPLHAVLGYSLGGAVALHLGRRDPDAGREPDRAQRLVVLGAAERPHPWALAARSVQRRLLRDAVADGDPARGLRLARALGMLSYRSAAEFARRFPLDREALFGDEPTEAERYLWSRSDRFVQDFDARSLHLLSRSLDLHDVDPATVSVPTTLIGVQGDQLVPPGQLEAFARRLPALRELALVDVDTGHDAFLVAPDEVGPWIRSSLEDLR